MTYKLYLLSYVRLVSRGQFFFFSCVLLSQLSVASKRKSRMMEDEEMRTSHSRLRGVNRWHAVRSSTILTLWRLVYIPPTSFNTHSSQHALLFRYFATFHFAFLHVLNFQFTFCYRGGDAVMNNYIAEEFFWCAKRL